MTFDTADFDYEPFAGVTHAVAKKDGKTAYQSDTARWAGVRRQQLAASAFAPERAGNRVGFYTTGEDYFKDVCEAIANASKSVFIAGWQVNWDVQLTPTMRLIDALKIALDRNARVYVMPWLSPKMPIDTGDFGTMLAVFQLNAGREGMPALCCPAGMQNDHAGIERTYFSHHQKLVVIDNSVAFVGGIDLAYGRRDDASFSLEHGWRRGTELYNSCIPPLHQLLPGEIANCLGESSLLKASLTSGMVQDAVLFQEQASRMAGRPPMGPVQDRLLAWWRSSNIFDDIKEQIPEFLVAPIEGLHQTVQAKLAAAQHQAASELIRHLEQGKVTDADVTKGVNLVCQFMNEVYIALLRVSWTENDAHPELLKPATKAFPSGGMVLREDQPRMPWQDVQCRIEGPSVYDVAMNFIRRWNSLQKAHLSPLITPRTRIGKALMPTPPSNEKSGGMRVRVLRSASLRLQEQECQAMPELPPAVDKQHEIHDMMCGVIEKAEHFIYIENQFFQSAFGEPSIKQDGKSPLSGPLHYLMADAGNRVNAAITRVGAAHADEFPGNQVADAIARRIEDAIRKDQPFHAYLVLPVHPEGGLNDLAIIGQIHWTMQSLVFASESLVNRIWLALAARQTCRNPRNDPEWEGEKKRLREELVTNRRNELVPLYQDKISLDGINRYLTLLNLRNCAVLGGKARTEQIYVHSKLLIADDRLAILGSANINDRSLRGDRDSEIAVWVADTESATARLDGKHPVKVRKAIHEFRKALWKKHFGAAARGLIQPAVELLVSALECPADPTTVSAIQRVAMNNFKAYAASFPFLPRDYCSLWPMWQLLDDDQQRILAKAWNAKEYVAISNAGAPYAKQMPFSEEFWTAKKERPAARPPAGVQGFICALPINWTKGENNHSRMNMVLLTGVDPDRGQIGDPTRSALNYQSSRERQA